MQDPSRSLEEQFGDAVRHHQAGRLAEAEQRYRRILALAPQHPHSLHMLGLIAFQTGHDTEAADLVSRAIALDPGNATAVRMLRRLDEVSGPEGRPTEGAKMPPAESKKAKD